MSNYIALIHKEPDSDYGVSFPDFPGCISADKDMDRIKDMAKEALSGHMQTMAEYGDKIPDPSKFEDIIADPANSDAVAFLLVPVSDPKSEKFGFNIPIPEYTFHQTDTVHQTNAVAEDSVGWDDE